MTLAGADNNADVKLKTYSDMSGSMGGKYVVFNVSDTAMVVNVRAFMTYRDADDVQHTVYSDTIMSASYDQLHN